MASPCVQPSMSPSPPMRKSGGCLGPWLGWFSHGQPCLSGGNHRLACFAWACPERHGCPAKRARWDGITPATPSMATNATPPFHPLPSSTFVPRASTRVRCVPRRCFPSPTHPHPHRGVARRGPWGGSDRCQRPVRAPLSCCTMPSQSHLFIRPHVDPTLSCRVRPQRRAPGC